MAPGVKEISHHQSAQISLEISGADPILILGFKILAVGYTRIIADNEPGSPRLLKLHK